MHRHSQGHCWPRFAQERGPRAFTADRQGCVRMWPKSMRRDPLNAVLFLDESSAALRKIPNGASRYYSSFGCNFACFRVKTRYDEKEGAIRRIARHVILWRNTLAMQRVPCTVAETFLWQATGQVDVCNSSENLSCRPRYLSRTLGISTQMQRSPNFEGSAEVI